MTKAKKLTCTEIAELFMKKSDKDTIIGDIFDFLGFDCTIRGYVHSDELDDLIKKFCSTSDIEFLCAMINLIQEGKKKACINEKALLNEIKQYISDHLTENMPLEQIAADLHISYYYLGHFFKQHTGLSLNRYRVIKRLEMAIRMLVETKIKISDIALNCGFNNISYFSEAFIQHTGETPSNFRKSHKDSVLHSFYEFNDMLLATKLPTVNFVNSSEFTKQEAKMSIVNVHDPSEKYGNFLHEAAIIEYEGVLYASWYNCDEKELVGYTPIRGRRSYDGGKTWSFPETIAEDKSGNILYCPPVYGICDGKLYLLLNQMVAPDHIHSLDLYIFNKETDKFEFLWSRPIPFKLNTNVIHLPNGKLMLPGRVGELDGFPNTPAVMISDSGKIDDRWRLIKVAPNGILPDGAKLIHPETTVICCNDTLYMFNRNDQRKVPLLYISNDLGESWSEAATHDIPYISSKIYGGRLSDGRSYLVANIDKKDRSKLVLYLGKKETMQFTNQIVLFDKETVDTDIIKCHYPAAVESCGKLHIIVTADYKGSTLKGRGALLFSVDLNSI